MTATQQISATGASPAITSAGGKAQAGEIETDAPAATSSSKKWVCAYEEGGQEAADLARQVGSKRTPAGTFFNIARPGHLRAQSTEGAGCRLRGAMQRMSLAALHSLPSCTVLSAGARLAAAPGAQCAPRSLHLVACQPQP